MQIKASVAFSDYNHNLVQKSQKLPQTNSHYLAILLAYNKLKIIQYKYI